jgi:hypothetical protein
MAYKKTNAGDSGQQLLDKLDNNFTELYKHTENAQTYLMGSVSPFALPTDAKPGDMLVNISADGVSVGGINFTPRVAASIVSLSPLVLKIDGHTDYSRVAGGHDTGWTYTYFYQRRSSDGMLAVKGGIHQYTLYPDDNYPPNSVLMCESGLIEKDNSGNNFKRIIEAPMFDIDGVKKGYCVIMVSYSNDDDEWQMIFRGYIPEGAAPDDFQAKPIGIEGQAIWMCNAGLA